MPPLSVIVQRVALEARSAVVLARAGLIAPDLPHRHIAMARSIVRYGAFGGLVSASAVRFGDRPALHDELGTLTWGDVDRRSNAVANALRRRGVKGGDGVAVLARNHRGFLDAIYGAGKCGARVILLNTDFAGPQIREVVERESTRLLICDEEYALVEGAEPELGVIRAWADTPGEDTLEHLINTGDPTPSPKPSEHARVIILTSGTTGTPKGAARSEPKSLIQVAALLGKIPFRIKQTHALGAPMFHALGLAMAILATSMGMTLRLRRRFDAEAFAADLAQSDCATVVPVMMRRVLPHAAGHDYRRLQIVFCGGSQLGAELCREITAAFGPVVYNLYGSTEVAYATIATPDELAIEPGSVGSPPPGAQVKILDEQGRELPTGQTGRIFVNNGFAFEGYTGGGTKEIIDGLMSSGDVGHFDHHGFLHVDGRDDEMIVSGAENVFPREVEELLAEHPGIEEAALIGVPDDEWGQRLAAFVVRAPDSDVDEAGVKGYVKEHLARYKVPRDVHFVDELPRNPTGKILKRDLSASVQ